MSNWTATKRNQEYAVFRLADGSVELSLDDSPGTEGPGCSIVLDKEDASGLIAALSRAIWIAGE